MKYTPILLLLLSGCVGVPVKNSFPDVPKKLLEPPAELSAASDSSDLDVFLTTVTDNYSTCNANTNLLLAWQEWYRIQRGIMEK